MKTIDIILILLLLFGAFRGFVKGFLMEIIGIVALLIAVWSGIELMDWGVRIASTWVSGYESLLPFISFFVVFLFVLVIITITGRILKGALDLTLLGAVDNFAGALLGLLKWSFAISLLFWLAEGVGVPVSSEVKTDSYIYPIIDSLAPNTVYFLSKHLPFMEDFFQSLREVFKDNN